MTPSFCGVAALTKQDFSLRGRRAADLHFSKALPHYLGNDPSLKKLQCPAPLIKKTASCAY
jgi:hypothetical protein